MTARRLSQGCWRAVVFNTFFGARLELLADRGFFSTWPNPYDFNDVTELVRSLGQ
jgi:hypothetical protein